MCLFVQILLFTAKKKVMRTHDNWDHDIMWVGLIPGNRGFHPMVKMKFGLIPHFDAPKKSCTKPQIFVLTCWVYGSQLYRRKSNGLELAFAEPPPLKRRMKFSSCHQLSASGPGKSHKSNNPTSHLHFFLPLDLWKFRFRASIFSLRDNLELESVFNLCVLGASRGSPATNLAASRFNGGTEGRPSPRDPAERCLPTATQKLITEKMDVLMCSYYVDNVLYIISLHIYIY